MYKRHFQLLNDISQLQSILQAKGAEINEVTSQIRKLEAEEQRKQEEGKPKS